MTQIQWRIVKRLGGEGLEKGEAVFCGQSGHGLDFITFILQHNLIYRITINDYDMKISSFGGIYSPDCLNEIDL